MLILFYHQCSSMLILFYHQCSSMLINVHHQCSSMLILFYHQCSSYFIINAHQCSSMLILFYHQCSSMLILFYHQCSSSMLILFHHQCSSYFIIKATCTETSAFKRFLLHRRKRYLECLAGVRKMPKICSESALVYYFRAAVKTLLISVIFIAFWATMIAVSTVYFLYVLLFLWLSLLFQPIFCIRPIRHALQILLFVEANDVAYNYIYADYNVDIAFLNRSLFSSFLVDSIPSLVISILNSVCFIIFI